MKTFVSFLLVTVFFTTSSFAQKYFTKTGKINFDATTSSSPDKINGINKAVTCVMDIKTGNIQFATLMKGFEFEKALMEEHFNENYMESEKFPKAEFKGLIANNAEVNYAKDGSYQAKVKGQLTMHGITKYVEAEGKLVVQKGRINTVSDFKVLLSDYNISIPAIVSDKVSKTATISVNCLLELLK